MTVVCIATRALVCGLRNDDVAVEHDIAADCCCDRHTRVVGCIECRITDYAADCRAIAVETVTACVFHVFDNAPLATLYERRLQDGAVLDLVDIAGQCADNTADCVFALNRDGLGCTVRADRAARYDDGNVLVAISQNTAHFCADVADCAVGGNSRQFRLGHRVACDFQLVVHSLCSRLSVNVAHDAADVVLDALDRCVDHFAVANDACRARLIHVRFVFIERCCCNAHDAACIGVQSGYVILIIRTLFAVCKHFEFSCVRPRIAVIDNCVAAAVRNDAANSRVSVSICRIRAHIARNSNI